MRPNWFIALPCPAGAWFVERVGGQGPPACVRLFHRDDLHLSVAFLGAVNEEHALAAWSLADTWSRGPVAATLGSVVGMGPPRRFSALSALLEEGRESIEAGMDECRDAMLSAAGASPARHRIKAHMTIGRIQRRASATQRQAALAWAEALPLLGTTIQVNEIGLYTWAENRNERQFRIVERRLLS